MPGYVWLLCHGYNAIPYSSYTASIFRLITRDHDLSPIVMLRHRSLLFVKLFQCQVVFGCSFHIFTRSHALSRIIINGHPWPFF
jgi:hypothetical protein